MKHLILAAAAASIALAGQAGAADLPKPLFGDSKVMVPGAAVTWEGAYIGGQAGYVNFGDSDVNGEGAIGGAMVGYDFQRGSLVFGPYVSANWSNAKIKFPGEEEGDSGGTVNKGLDWSAGGRAGWLISKSTLVHIKAGYTQAFYNEKWDGGTDTTRLDGFEVGGGAEFNVAPGLFVGAEYLHRELHDGDVAEDVGLLTAKFKTGLGR